MIPVMETVGAGILGNVFDSIFGSVDQGHWEGSRFVPGDINHRIQRVGELINEYGLSQADVDYNSLIESLYYPGIWQARVSQYLQKVVDEKRNALANSQTDPQNSNPVINPNQPVVDQVTAQTYTKQAGMSTTTLLILAGAAFFLLKR